MAVMAKWNGKTWEVSSKQIKALDGLTAGAELDTDNNDDKAGSPATNTKALKLKRISPYFDVAKVAGVDPRTEYESWENMVGEYAPFYLGGSQFGPKNMQLTAVSLSDVLLSDSGTMLKARISIVLTEYAEEASSKKATAGAGGSTAPGISSGVGERLTALNVAASATAKAAHNRSMLGGKKSIDVIQQYEK